MAHITVNSISDILNVPNFECTVFPSCNMFNKLMNYNGNLVMVADDNTEANHFGNTSCDALHLDDAQDLLGDKA